MLKANWTICFYPTPLTFLYMIVIHGVRQTVIINPEGKPVTSEENFYNVGRNASELVRKMEANVHLMANPSEACPANWKPGAKTLTPGKDIGGNVAFVIDA